MPGKGIERKQSVLLPGLPKKNQAAAEGEITRIGHHAKLDIDSDPTGPRRTKIVCTIGPASGTMDMITKLRMAGLNVMRLNFSHGTHEYHAQRIEYLRESCKLYPGPPVALALDTKGPEIRTGMLIDGEFSFEAGDIVNIHLEDEWVDKGTKTDIYCDYKNLPHVMSVGGTIYIDDGLLEFEALELSPEVVVAKCINGGPMGNRKGCNLPNVKTDLPALSEKDKADLTWGVEQGFDVIFASFIRKAEDIAHIRQHLGEKGAHVKIIAKIENHEGVKNFPEILDAADGAMVARGDMGIEIPPEKVFLAQKMIVARCNLVGKPVICATQMLESMKNNPRPTRAEVSDVANAVLDGVDCVMLSEETAAGCYPVQAVTLMAKICREAEAAYLYYEQFNDLKTMTPRETTPEVVALAAVEASFKQKAAAIVVLSLSGKTAKLLAKYKPNCPVLAVTRDERVARQLCLSRDVFPLVYTEPMAPIFQDDVDARLNWSLQEAMNANFVKSGDSIVTVQGWREGTGHTNTMRVVMVE